MAQTNLFKQLVVNNITLEEAPFPSELGMEAFLMDNPRVLAFGDEPEGYPKVIDCEISLSRKTEIQSGTESSKTDRCHSRLDMLVQYSEFTFAVLELKKGDVDDNALKQLRDYLTPERRKEIIEIIKEGKELEYLSDANNEKKAIFNFMGVLVGSCVSEEFKKKVLEQPSEENQPKEFRIITLSRFRNKATGDLYVLANKMMQTKTNSNKDTTTYKFNGLEKLSKGRLVNAVVRYYVEQHPKISYDELKQQFPDNLQGNKFGVFQEVSEAQKENDKDSRHIRYYTADDMVIELSDAKIATCNNWYGGTGKNMAKFIAKATELIPERTIEPMD